MNNLITVGKYPPSQIIERYIYIRSLQKAYIICQHWTSRRDLRKEKRYSVELEHGKCSLEPKLCSCKSFQKIPELRGKNMTIEEKLYARMYTKTFLRQVHRFKFRQKFGVKTMAFHTGTTNNAFYGKHLTLDDYY
jgi:hypothetical protein